MKVSWIGGVALTLAIAALAAQPDGTGDGQTAADGAGDPVERGRYLVHHVAQCVQCHSPRDPSGSLIEQDLLRGAPVPLRSPYLDVEWAFQAPRIAGLPGWDEATAVHLLMHGERPDGRAPLPPMPRFQMTEDDARAVVAYLKSLR